MNQTEKIDAIEKLPVKRKIGYLMGMIPTTLFIGFFQLAYAKFFLDQLQLKPVYWYTGLVIYAIINAFNDPIIGYISDNTNVEKWGSRRIIYIKWGAPLLTIAFLLIWWIPTNHGSQFLLFLHFFLTICFYDTFMTMVVMTWMALLPDMTMDIGERTKINFIGSIIAVIFALPLLVVSTLEHEQIKLFSIPVAGMGLICYILVVILSKEKPEHQHDKPVPIRQAIKYTLWNKGHLCVIGFNFLTTFSGAMGSAFLFMYWYILGVQNLIWYYLIVFGIGYISSIVAILLRKRFGIFNLMIKSGILQVICGFVTFFVVLNRSMEWFIWVGLILSAIFGGAFVFRGNLHMLVIDQDEVKSGQRREGMYFGMNALLIKPAESLGAIAGTALLLLFGYSQGSQPIAQPDEVILGIKILFLLIPQIINILVLILIKIFPIQGERLTQLEQDLDKIHQEKRKVLQSN